MWAAISRVMGGEERLFIAKAFKMRWKRVDISVAQAERTCASKTELRFQRGNIKGQGVSSTLALFVFISIRRHAQGLTSR